MVHEIAADRIVPTGPDGNLDLGAHSIGTRHQHRLVEALRKPEHPPKPAEPADYAGREGRFNEVLDSILGRIGGIQIDARASVAKRIIAHAGSSSSNVTRRRISRIR